MISLSDYFQGRDKIHADELNDDIRSHAVTTTERANRLLAAYEASTGDTETRYVTSGWRPPSVNARTEGAAIKSKHMTGQAIDISDPGGDLDDWCMDNLPVLAKIGLWMEHPSVTKNYCHVQTVPPKSERRVFFP